MFEATNQIVIGEPLVVMLSYSYPLVNIHSLRTGKSQSIDVFYILLPRRTGRFSAPNPTTPQGGAPQL